MFMHKYFLPALLALLGILAVPMRAQAGVEQWQKGMTFPAWGVDHYTAAQTVTALDRYAALDPDTPDLNGNWVSIVPTWYMRRITDNTIYPETSGGSPTDDSLRFIVQQAHARGLKVMLKPTVDPRDGNWRGSIAPTRPRDWFASYRTFIVHYAQLAEEIGAEQFCVGTELLSMTGSPYTSNPDFAGYWRSLIDDPNPSVGDIRKYYSGPLTYAANWGYNPSAEYLNVQWWDMLDYIGVDAYFPISDAKTPTVAEVVAGWSAYKGAGGGPANYLADMQALHEKYGKQIIFTELGFRNQDCAGNPWLNAPWVANPEGQQNCIEGTLQVMEKQDWFAGFYWWMWYIYPDGGGPDDIDMTLNNKPGRLNIRAWYAQDIVDTRPPKTPTGLTAQALSATEIKLDWNATTDNMDVAGYQLYRDGRLVATVVDTGYSDTNLSPKTTYTYRVTEIDAALNVSDPSNTASATTLTPADQEAPTVPAKLTANPVSITAIDLTWRASTDNVGVVAYQVYRDKTLVATVTATRFRDTGLLPDTTYSYEVLAVDAAGNKSDLCPPVSATTLPDTEAPAAPAELTATAVSDTAIRLGWTATTDNVGVTSFNIYRQESNGNFRRLATVEGAAATFIDNGLKAKTTYTYRVTALDAARNESGPSNEASATTLTVPDTQPPAVPAGLTVAAVSGTAIALQWNASTDNVQVTGYNIYRKSAGGNFALLTTVADIAYTDSGLTPATAYTYRITALDAAGNESGASDEQTATTLDSQPPSAPANLAATTLSGTEIRLQWGASTDTVGVAGYNIYRKNADGSFALLTAVAGAVTTYNDSSLTMGTTYTYQVTAVDAAGNESDPSNAVSATTLLNAPVIQSAKPISRSQIEIQWIPPSGDLQVMVYRIYRDGVPLITITGTSYNDSNLNKATTYTYQVSAIDAAGKESALSAPVSATTPKNGPPKR